MAASVGKKYSPVRCEERQHDIEVIEDDRQKQRRVTSYVGNVGLHTVAPLRHGI